MKNALIIAGIVLGTGPVIIDPVFAAGPEGTTCRTAQNVADAGYFVSVSANNKTADLEEQTIAGFRKVADMDCQLLPVKHYPDALNNYMICRDARNQRDGLVIRFFSGGIAGLHYASIRSQANFDGARTEREIEFGRLNCN